MTFADYTMSDVLFLTLVVWVLVAPGVASGLPRLSSHALVAMLTATAILSAERRHLSGRGGGAG